MATKSKVAPRKNEAKSPGKKAPAGTSRPGMLGDGTEEQNLSQPGNPGARIKQAEVAKAFGKKPKK